MAILNKLQSTAEHLIYDEMVYSRETASVDNTADTTNPLVAGSVLGKITATGVYVKLDPSASDGSEAASGVLYEGVNAGETADRSINVRHTSVDGNMLQYDSTITTAQKDTAEAELLALGVVVRK